MPTSIEWHCFCPTARREITVPTTQKSTTDMPSSQQSQRDDMLLSPPIYTTVTVITPNDAPYTMGLSTITFHELWYSGIHTTTASSLFSSTPAPTSKVTFDTVGLPEGRYQYS